LLKTGQIIHFKSLDYENMSMMITLSPRRFSIGLVTASIFAFLGTIVAPAQQPDTAAVIQQVDAAVKARVDNIAGYTSTEHYSVYRNKDETHPVAEMTVRTAYRKDTGKSYTILSQTGSEIIRSLVLGEILNNEKLLSQPGIREGAWITSANYEIKLKPGETQPLDGNSVDRLERWFDRPGAGNSAQEFFHIHGTHAVDPSVHKCQRLSAGHPCQSGIKQLYVWSDDRTNRLSGLSGPTSSIYIGGTRPCLTSPPA
jgi:hypothetical protein